MKKELPSVAFVNPPGPGNLYRGIVCAYVSKANYLWQPHDFINLSAQIPADYNLKLIDCSINNKDSKYLFKEVEALNPFLAIFSISSIVLEQDMMSLRDFRARFSHIKCLVLGNVLLERAFWGKVLENSDGLILNSLDIDLSDYIKTGKSKSLNLVLKGNTKDRPEEQRCKIATKKVSIGVPRHEIFINKKYRFPFMKSGLYSAVSVQFGCPFQCGYCSWAKIPVSYRDYNEVLDEIRLINDFGVRDIFFADPSFGYPEDNAAQLLEGVIKRKLKMRWSCYANPLLLNNDFLKLMKKAGCHTVIIGVDDDNFDLLKTKYNRDIPKEKIMDFCSYAHGLGIQICGDFIIGLDGSGNSIEGIIKIASELKLDYASFNIYAILAGSLVREQLIREGRFEPAGISADPSGNFGPIDKKLIYLRDEAVKRFYLRPTYLLGRVLKLRSLGEFVVQAKEMSAMFKSLGCRRSSD